ncbi:MAG: Na/Pi cotransporter family protein [Lachnospiraceae bacterium]|nr:Na/Pi cotransporter family protein [Lachnospiraceae bacterium]
MDGVTVATAILSLLAGVGIFLVACSTMSSNLEAVSSNKLKNLFAKASKSKMTGVAIGAVGTAAIQSSGATTVMVIGFVNAGIMSLTQAATVIYGANIGTTITGQIVALGMFGGNSLSTTVIFSAFAGIGAFITLFAKKDTVKKFGGIFAGFGMLFVGLSMMSGSMEVFSELDSVKLFLANINNAVLLVLVGAILTAIVQSSSVMTSVAITMLVTGLITLSQGIYLTMGSNIGSCMVAMIAGLSSSKNAKRTAFVHLIFNVSGVVVFLILGGVISLVTGGNINFGVIFESLFPGIPQTQLAMFHTVFNLLTVIIMLPLTKILTDVVCKIVPDTEETEAKEKHLHFLDSHMLRTPPIAVAQLKNEIVNMADIAMTNFNRALDIISTQDFKDEEVFKETENELNFINRELVHYIVELSKMQLNESDHAYLATALRSSSDLERVGDYAENIVEYATILRDEKQQFSVSAIAEIQYLREVIKDLFDNVMKAYKDKDIDALMKASEIEENVDIITEKMGNNHITRLNAGICTPLVGAQYLEMASNSERVADHLYNVAKAIKEWK